MTKEQEIEKAWNGKPGPEGNIQYRPLSGEYG